MVIFVWLVIGWIGAFLLWNEERRMEGFDWCPTPRAILVGFFAGCLGPLMLLIGVSWFIAGLVVQVTSAWSWWTTPICKSRREKRAKDKKRRAFSG